jgi:hypothetical protein
MADSDNSRTLSPVTRRDFYSVLAASLPTCQCFSTLQNGHFDARSDDPACVAWWASRGRLTESNQRQQQLEHALFSLGVALPSDVASTEWEYREALKAEDRASATEEEAADAVWQTPAQSIAGVTAKLHAAVTRWQPSPTSKQERWPQIRAVISDLLRIDASLAGGDRPPPMRELRSVIQGSCRASKRAFAPLGITTAAGLCPSRCHSTHNHTLAAPRGVSTLSKPRTRN